MRGMSDLTEAIVEGAVRRLRPKLMTGMALLAGLAPIFWSTGAGADVMKRIAAPMVGGRVGAGDGAGRLPSYLCLVEGA